MENGDKQMKKSRAVKIILALFVVVVIFVVYGVYSNLQGTLKNVSQNSAVLKSEVNKNLTYDLVRSDPDKHKGEIIQWGAKIFTQPEKDDGTVSFQAYADGDDRNFAVVYRGTNIDVKEDDYVIITGELLGKFEGENAFGAKLEIPAVQAFTIEKGTRNDVVAPTANVIEIKEANTQNKFTVFLEKVELAKNETRFLIKLKNDSNDKVRFYNFDSKLTQRSKQYEPESVYDSDQELPSEILPGIEADGYVIFPVIDPNLKQLTLFLDEPSSDNYDLDWDEVKFDINLP